MFRGLFLPKKSCPAIKTPLLFTALFSYLGTKMTEQTFIPGKDAALEDSIAKFQQKLTALGFNIEEAS